METTIIIVILTIACITLIINLLINTFNVETIKKDTIVCRSLYVTKNFEVFVRKDHKDIKEGDMIVEGILYLHGDIIDVKELQENYQKLLNRKTEGHWSEHHKQLNNEITNRKNEKQNE